MRRGYAVCLAILLLFVAAPLFAQGSDTGSKEEVTPMAAHTDSGNPPAAVSPNQAQQGKAGPGWHRDLHHRHGEMHRGYRAEHGGFLNLSNDQRAKMRELWLRHFAATHDLRYDLMQKRVEMARLFTDPKASGAAILAKQKEMSAIRQQLMDQRAQAVVEWRSLLTPEQIQKLDLMVMLRHRVGHEMGHGYGMGHEMHSGMMGDEMGRGMMDQETDRGRIRHEMEQGTMRHEMDQGPMRHEMGSGMPGNEMDEDTTTQEMGAGTDGAATTDSDKTEPAATGSGTTDSGK